MISRRTFELMQIKNNLLTGLLSALIFPLFAFVVDSLFKNTIFFLNKPAVPYLVALALNLIALRVCIKKDLDKTARGVMVATFALLLLVLKLKTHF